MARTYLMKTQGDLIQHKFDMHTANFNATFVIDTSIQYPTVMFASKEYYYPLGFRISLTVDG